jgi:hypothetical protein
MRPGDTITHGSRTKQGHQPVDGVDPSRVNWDGSPCSYASDFVEFVYREERERRR